MAWNGSNCDQGCECSRSHKVTSHGTRAQSRQCRRMIACGIIAILFVVGVFLVAKWLEGWVREPAVGDRGKVQKPQKIAERPVKSTPLLANPVVEQETKPRRTAALAVPIGNVMTARTAKVGRVMTLMDGTVVTNKVQRPFKRDLEHSLWVALRPGNMGAGLLTTLQNRHSEHEIIEMLKEATLPVPGDSEGMIRIKAEVQDLKERILHELDNGRSLSDIFDEIRNQGIAESKIKADTMRLRAEAIRSGDAQQVRDTVQHLNEIRTKQGLEPLTVPDEFKAIQEQVPDQQTFMEFHN